MAEPSLALQLREIGEALPAAFARGDAAFLAIGDRLSEAVGIFARLGKLFASLEASLDDPRLGEAAAALSGVGRDIAGLAAALREEEGTLGRLRELNAQLARHIEVIRRTIRAINMLAVNAHISASDMPAEGEDVASFALRFKQLAGSARTTIAAAAAQCDRLGKALEAAQVRQAGFMLEHDRVLGLLAGQIEDRVRAMDERRAKAAEVSRVIAVGSQQISVDIGTLVMALQINDITRQRLDHVAQALAAVAAEPASDDAEAQEPAWCAGLGTSEREAIAIEVCRLEQAQMGEAVRDFDGEVERAAGSLRRLVREAEDLVALGGRGYGNGQQGFASFLSVLQAELNRALSLFGTCQRHRAEVDAGMAAAAVALRKLLEQLAEVELIEEHIRLVSLNTAFLCQRIGGKGRVLATIAQELRNRASRLLADVRRLSEVVEEIGGVAGSFEQSREAHGAARMAAMEQTIAAALEPLRARGADLAAALARLAPEGTAVGETLRSSVATLDRLSELGHTLRALQRRLGRAADRRPQGAVDEALRRERLRLFPVCYTMASERAIHVSVCGWEADDATTASADVSLDVLF